MIYAVYEVVWTEHERGWGSRPDGKSYHKSKKVAESYIKNYWDSMPDETPDEYSKPSQPQLIEVNKKDFDKIRKQGSIRCFQGQSL